MVERLTCLHGPGACCWLCDWDAQPWWVDARLKAILTGKLSVDDVAPLVRTRLAIVLQFMEAHSG